MLLLEWLICLLIGAVALTALARRLAVPYPAFLAVGGAGLALSPVGPNLVLAPDLALALFVAPVLLDAAYDASLRDLRQNWLPISLLVLAVVGLTTIAVAIIARWLLPDLPWAAAIALGAIVAPPDATAAAAVLRQVKLPFRINTILEGESLLNDASALFIYRLALTAVAAGSFQASAVLTSFILVLPLSLAAGYGLAQVTTRLIDRITDAPSSIIIQFASTFGIWILAEKLQLSAVLTIVAYAATISHRGPRRFNARLRIPAFAVWETATFLLNILAFVMIGLQLRPILEGMQTDRLAFALGFAAAILATCLLIRFAWMLIYYLARRQAAVLRGLTASSSRPTFQGAMVVNWCGMRGIVTLAAALALPDGSAGEPAFPHRELMQLTAFSVVLGSLVLQGLTLRPLLAWADLKDDDPVGRETGHARTEVIRAALASIATDESAAAHALRQEYAFILEEAEAHPSGFAPAMSVQDELRLRAIAAGRQRLTDMRRAAAIGDNAYSRIEAELDQAEMNASEV